MGDVVRRRAARAARLAGVVAAVALAATGCSGQEVLRFGWPQGVTPQAREMQYFWGWAVVAALVIGVLVWGLMLWAIIFHRKRAGDSDLPRQTQYNLPLEITYTIIPFVIIAGLFYFTVITQNYVDAIKPNPDVRVNVTAFQWNWEFDYPDAKSPTGQPVSTVGTSNTVALLVLPTDRSVQFTLRSRDVIHSFWIPDFLFKRDVFPDPEKNDTQNVFQIDKIDHPGAFIGRCAEFCGAYHSQMDFEVRALPPALFQRYLQLRGEVDPATGLPYDAGEALATMNCGELCTPVAITTHPFPTSPTATSGGGPIG